MLKALLSLVLGLFIASATEAQVYFAPFTLVDGRLVKVDLIKGKILDTVTAEQGETCAQLVKRAKRVRLKEGWCIKMLESIGRRPTIDNMLFTQAIEGKPIILPEDMFIYVQGQGWILTAQDFD